MPLFLIDFKKVIDWSDDLLCYVFVNREHLSTLPNAGQSPPSFTPATPQAQPPQQNTHWCLNYPLRNILAIAIAAFSDSSSKSQKSNLSQRAKAVSATRRDISSCLHLKHNSRLLGERKYWLVIGLVRGIYHTKSVTVFTNMFPLADDNSFVRCVVPGCLSGGSSVGMLKKWESMWNIDHQSSFKIRLIVLRFGHCWISIHLI